ncbi:MAG: endonuclease/exonuclease/phosphatase family protein [Deltaproteobacteria bacterium]|jgi:endonuclease/exonuclease/phosphatase family metal-dependent hydrolase
MVSLGVLTLTLALGASPAPEPTTLRVLTYNIWGIPLITPARAERVEAIGRAIAEVEPDLVALQEVWMERDAMELTRALERAGLPHVRHFATTFPGGSGLLVASRYPIERDHFRKYSQGQVPHTPWHLDWIAGKGAAVVEVRTPTGPVRFSATHLQAGYGSDEYVPVQLSQMLEASAFLTKLPKRDDVPLILAGDLNADWSALPFRVLAARAGLVPTDARCGIDAILYRPGRRVDVKTVAVTKVFEAPRDVDGERIRLSDHGGVLAQLALVPVERPVTMLGMAQDRWRTIVEESSLLVVARLRRAEDDLFRHRVLAAAGFFLMVVALVSRRRYGKARRVMGWTSFVLAFVASWYLYLGVAYGPSEIASLTDLSAQLSSPP